MNLTTVKFLSILILTLITSLSASSQSKVFVYYFDAELNPAAKEKAAITGRGVKTETGVTVSFLNNQTKKVFNVSGYSDSSLSILHGKNIDYYDNGKVKRSETFSNNVLNGPAIKYDSTGLLIDSIIYDNEKMLNKTRYEYDFSGKMNRKTFTDSVKNIYTDIFLGATGKKTSEVNFTGNKGVWKYYNTDGSVSKTENVTTRERKDASFPGGEEAWKDYLAKELNSLLAYENKAPEGEHVVMVSFTVDKEGNLLNITPVTRQGFGMEEEAVRVIQKSGKWIPASLYGKIIKSHRLQPVQFLVNK